MQKRYKKLLTDTGLFALSSFGSKILTILLVPLYTSVLETGEYGTADILTTTANVLYPILSLTIYEATLRFALDSKYEKRTVFSISMFFSAIAIIALLLFSPIIINTNTIFGRYWWFFVGIFVGITISTTVSYYLKGREQTKIYAVQGVVFTTVYLLLNIVFLLFLHWGVPGYFSSMIIAYCASITYMIVASKCYKDLCPISFDKNLCKEMLLFSIPMIPTSVAWFVNVSADKYMIFAILGVGANGLYGVAHKIPSIFSTVSSLFSQAWRISAISSYNEKDSKNYYEKVYRCYTIACLYFCIVLILLSQIIALVLFKNEFYQAWVYIPPLVISALFSAYSAFLYSLYVAAKKTSILSITSFAGALLNVGLNLLFIKYFGALGASIATMLSFAVVWIITEVAISTFMQIMTNRIRLGISVALTMLLGVYFAFQGILMYVIGIIVLFAVILLNYHTTKELTRIILGILIGLKNSMRRMKKNG